MLSWSSGRRTSIPSIVFRSVWLHQPPDARLAAIAAEERFGVDDYLEPETKDDAEPPSRASTTLVRYSRAEVLRSKDFGECTAADFADAQRLMADLRATAAMRRSRRRRPAKWRRHRQPDIRATPPVRCAPVESPSPEPGMRRPCNPASLFCYVMSAARWTPTPGRYCGSCTRRWLAPPRGGLHHGNTPDPADAGAVVPRPRSSAA